MPHFDLVYIPACLTIIFLIASVITVFSSPTVDGHIQPGASAAFRWSFRLCIVSFIFLALIFLARAGVTGNNASGDEFTYLLYNMCIFLAILAVLLPITTFGNWVSQWLFRGFIMSIAFCVLGLLSQEHTTLRAYENIICVALVILVLQLQFRVGRLQKKLKAIRSENPKAA